MRIAERLRWVGLEGMVLVALLRAFLVIVPQVWFDVDPALDPMPLLAAGAAASHVLDLALLAVACCALVGEWRSGRGVHAWLVALACLPLPVIAFSAFGLGFEHGFRGMTWLAGMVAFVALAHLVRDRPMRVVALSTLLAASALLAVRGGVQVLVEHPATVALYEETREAFLAERGWAPDGAAARSYERRLMQPEASGWFGLANPFSMSMGVGVVAFAGLAVLARARQQAGSTLLLLGASLGCLALLAVNGSKGAIVATALSGALLAYLVRGSAPPRAAWVLAVAGLALLAVAARGAVGLAIDEKSLLFRSYYLEAAVAMLRDVDILVLGTGPDGVQQWFNRAKPPECPEDVKSLHSVFADWIVTLGISGVAWVGAVLSVFLRRVELAGADQDGTDTAGAGLGPERARRGVLVLALAAGSIALLVQLLVEQPTVDVSWFVFRTLGLVAFALVAAVCAEALASLPGRTLAALSIAVAMLVLVHSQIETNAWMPSSCVLVLLLLACGSALADGPAPAAGPRRIMRGAGLALAGCALVLAGALAAVLLRSSVAREAHLRSVARSLAPLGELRRAGSRPDPKEEIDARIGAIARLTDAAAPWSRASVDAAVRQAVVVARTSRARAREAIELAWVPAFRRELGGPRVQAMRADLALERLRLPGEDPDTVRRCVEAVERAASLQPNNPRRWIDVGVARQACAPLGGCGDPAEAWQRALSANERMFLDPLVQLSEREIAYLREALARGGGGGSAP